ncbi:MAG: YcfL family protein [Victivallales bacterium]|nr:YcfL family protein [Victivallales bacterium]
MKWKNMVLLAMMLGLLLTGCATRVPEYSVEDAERGQLVVVGTDVASAVLVKNATLSENASGTLQLSVDVQNVSRSYLPLEYRTFWYREDGRVISTALSNWNRRGFASGETLTLTANAIHPEAKFSRMQFRRAKK